MRSLLAVSLLLCAPACCPPMKPAPPPPAAPVAAEDAPDSTPHVVRRLVGEAQEQVEKNRQMASDLPDPRGRERAQGQVAEVSSELAALAARLDDADSDNLDDVMAKLKALDARIDDLHDALRVATERTTAVLN